jgi:hypothetical protein
MDLYDSIVTDNDDLLPVEGKDEAYDEIANEIRGLEKELDKALKKLERQVAYVLLSFLSFFSHHCTAMVDSPCNFGIARKGIR